MIEELSDFAFRRKLSKKATEKLETAWANRYIPRAGPNMMYMQRSLGIPAGEITGSLSVFLAST